MKNNKLDNLEKSTIIEILKYNFKDIINIEEKVNSIQVLSREYTGVGLYVNLSSDNLIFKNPNGDKQDFILSTDKPLVLDCLKDLLIYELNFTEGKPSFIEYVTLQEDWNGKFNDFSFQESFK